MLRLIVMIFAAYLLFSAGILGSFASSKADVSVQGSEVTVTTSDASMHFAAGQPVRLAGRVMDWRKAPQSFRQMGVQAIASLLSPVDYAQFEKIVSSKRCPTSFLNGHARTYIFFAQTPETASRISSARYEQGAQPSLNVRPLRYKSGIYKGHDLRAFNSGENLLLVTQ